MKKILNYFVFGAVAVIFSAALASCQKESATDKTSTPETPVARVIHVDLSANVADTKANYSNPNVNIEDDDQLYVALTGPESAWTATGTLTYETDKFSGDITINTGSYEGSDPIKDAKDLTATFLPDGYDTVGYLSAAGVATAANAFYAGAKDDAVPQLVHLTASVTNEAGVAKSPLTLVPQNAVLCYSIEANKLAAGAHDVSVSNGTSTISGSVTAVAAAATTFAVAFPANATPTDYTLGVTWYGKMVKENKTLAAGHVVNISVSALTPYVFSVSSTLTVKFSPGNLQAVFASAGTSCTWKFADHQWDFIGGRTAGEYQPETGNNFINGNGSVSAAGTVDYFGWSTSATVLGINNSENKNDYVGVGGFVDWGSNASVQAGIGTGWRTLTGGDDGGEWKYLLETRSGTLYCKATVNSIVGLVIFPDSYSHPAGVTAVASANTAEAAFNTNSWSGTAWTLMETAGAVFLPAAGRRLGTSVYAVGERCSYWSSTRLPTKETSGYSLTVDNAQFIIDDASIHRGLSVRLVKNQ